MHNKIIFILFLGFFTHISTTPAKKDPTWHWQTKRYFPYSRYSPSLIRTITKKTPNSVFVQTLHKFNQREQFLNEWIFRLLQERPVQSALRDMPTHIYYQHYVLRMPDHIVAQALSDLGQSNGSHT